MFLNKKFLHLHEYLQPAKILESNNLSKKIYNFQELQHKHKSKTPNIFFAVFENFIHLLKDFAVNLALISATGILYCFAFKIKLGQISESTIHNADQIFVLKNGKILSNGKHDFLIDNCEEYKALYTKQLR